MVSAPKAAASGTPPNTAIDTVLQTSITGRFGSRSTQAPAGRPTSSHGNQATAVSSATSKVLARSVTTATSGNAVLATMLPSMLVVSPVQSSRKSLFPQSPFTAGPAKPARRRRPDGARPRRPVRCGFRTR